MAFSLLTYNVLFNKACTELKTIFEKYKPDIVCLQEMDTDEPKLKEIEKLGDYRLADYSNSFIKFGKIYGIATFYNSKTVNILKSEIYNLSQSIPEMFIAIIRMLKGGDQPRTILETNFKLKENNKTITVYNTHLTVYGINSARIKQIKQSLAVINEIKDQPILFCGDFNYFPYERKNLENLMKKNNFKEATENITYSFERTGWQYNIFERLITSIVGKLLPQRFNRMKLDYIFYKNIRNIKTQKIDVNFSDHFPILSLFE